MSRIRVTGIKQTAATKKCSSNFSIAVGASRAALTGLADIFSFKDGTRYNRLTGAFNSWLQRNDLSEISAGPMHFHQGFEINPQKMLGSKWQKKLIYMRNDDGLNITLGNLVPEEMMAIPKNTSMMKFTVATMVINLHDPHLNQHHSASILIPPNKQLFTGTAWQHDLSLKPGSIILSGFSIECLDDNSWPVNVRKGYTLPAEIMYAEWLGE